MGHPTHKIIEDQHYYQCARADEIATHGQGIKRAGDAFSREATAPERNERIMASSDRENAARVRASFGRQHAMTLLGAEMAEVKAGMVEIVLPFREELTQQHGFIHAGMITAIVDSACGYAALSLMPPGVGVLTIEFKVNLLNPAAGERFIARGQVVKPGRTIMVCTGEVIAERADGNQQTVALMQTTMMVVRDRPSILD